MNLKCWLRNKRRSFRVKLAYYVTLFVIFVFLIQWLKNPRANSQLNFNRLTGADEVSVTTGLYPLLKVSSTSKICRKAKPIDVYELCYETNVGRIPTNNIILVSAESQSIKLEDELPYELDQIQINRLFGEEQNYFRRILSRLSKLPFIGRFFWFEIIKRACIQGDNSTYKLLKLGNLPDKLEKYKANTILKLINGEILQTFHQIFIIINSDGENDDEWIDAVNLLKNSNYQLFSVHKDCAGILCTFATSWLKIDAEMQKLDEEINPLDPNFDFAEKLHSLLRTTTTSCKRKVIVPSTVSKENAYSSASRWPVCLDEVEPPCIVYSTKIGSSELFENILARLGCDVYVFDSTYDVNSLKTKPKIDEKMHKYNWTLGGMTTRIISGLSQPDTMSYVKASDVLQRLGHENQMINILRLDLHGGEWDVIDSILNAKQDKTYQQLLLTVHVWHGEDRLNLLDRLLRLKKLFHVNYRIFHSEPLTVGDNNPCCYLIGLINSNLIS
ncbi:hypothetical protein CHUAL_009573 [Chamberlinius hualienensis]